MTTASLSPRRGSRDSRRKPAPTAAFSPPPSEPRFQAAMQGGEYVQSRASSTACVESADLRRKPSRVISRLAAPLLNAGTQQIGRTHACTPLHNAHYQSRLTLEK